MTRTKTELALSLFKAIESQNIALLNEIIDEEFSFSGFTPLMLNKTQFIELFSNLVSAFPNWKFNHTVLVLEDELVKGSIQITADNTQDFAISIPHMYDIYAPASGKRINLSREKFEIYVLNDKIIDCMVHFKHEPCIVNIMEQLDLSESSRMLQHK